MAGTTDPFEAWVYSVLPGALRQTGKHPVILLREGWSVEWVNQVAGFDLIDQESKVF